MPTAVEDSDASLVCEETSSRGGAGAGLAASNEIDAASAVCSVEWKDVASSECAKTLGSDDASCSSRLRSSTSRLNPLLLRAAALLLGVDWEGWGGGRLEGEPPLSRRTSGSECVAEGEAAPSARRLDTREEEAGSCGSAEGLALHEKRTREQLRRVGLELARQMQEEAPRLTSSSSRESTNLFSCPHSPPAFDAPSRGSGEGATPKGDSNPPFFSPSKNSSRGSDGIAHVHLLLKQQEQLRDLHRLQSEYAKNCASGAASPAEFASQMLPYLLSALTGRDASRDLSGDTRECSAASVHPIEDTPVKGLSDFQSAIDLQQQLFTPQADLPLEECSTCGRRFEASRLEVHSRICQVQRKSQEKRLKEHRQKELQKAERLRKVVERERELKELLLQRQREAEELLLQKKLQVKRQREAAAARVAAEASRRRGLSGTNSSSGSSVATLKTRQVFVSEKMHTSGEASPLRSATSGDSKQSENEGAFCSSSEKAKGTSDVQLEEERPSAEEAEAPRSAEKEKLPLLSSEETSSPLKSPRDEELCPEKEITSAAESVSSASPSARAALQTSLPLTEKNPLPLAEKTPLPLPEKTQSDKEQQAVGPVKEEGDSLSKERSLLSDISLAEHNQAAPSGVYTPQRRDSGALAGVRCTSTSVGKVSVQRVRPQDRWKMQPMEKCPHCQRRFGVKAFGRHAEVCAERERLNARRVAQLERKTREEERRKPSGRCYLSGSEGTQQHFSTSPFAKSESCLSLEMPRLASRAKEAVDSSVQKQRVLGKGVDGASALLPLSDALSSSLLLRRFIETTAVAAATAAVQAASETKLLTSSSASNQRSQDARAEAASQAEPRSPPSLTGGLALPPKETLSTALSSEAERLRAKGAATVAERLYTSSEGRGGKKSGDVGVSAENAQKETAAPHVGTSSSAAGLKCLREKVNCKRTSSSNSEKDSAPAPEAETKSATATRRSDSTELRKREPKSAPLERKGRGASSSEEERSPESLRCRRCGCLSRSPDPSPRHPVPAEVSVHSKSPALQQAPSSRLRRSECGEEKASESVLLSSVSRTAEQQSPRAESLRRAPNALEVSSQTRAKHGAASESCELREERRGGEKAKKRSGVRMGAEGNSDWRENSRVEESLARLREEQRRLFENQSRLRSEQQELRQRQRSEGALSVWVPSVATSVEEAAFERDSSNPSTNESFRSRPSEESFSTTSANVRTPSLPTLRMPLLGSGASQQPSFPRASRRWNSLDKGDGVSRLEREVERRAGECKVWSSGMSTGVAGGTSLEQSAFSFGELGLAPHSSVGSGLPEEARQNRPAVCGASRIVPYHSHSAVEESLATRREGLSFAEAQGIPPQVYRQYTAAPVWRGVTPEPFASVAPHSFVQQQSFSDLDRTHAPFAVGQNFSASSRLLNSSLGSAVYSRSPEPVAATPETGSFAAPLHRPLQKHRSFVTEAPAQNGVSAQPAEPMQGEARLSGWELEPERRRLLKELLIEQRAESRRNEERRREALASEHPRDFSLLTTLRPSGAAVPAAATAGFASASSSAIAPAVVPSSGWNLRSLGKGGVLDGTASFPRPQMEAPVLPPWLLPHQTPSTSLNIHSGRGAVLRPVAQQQPLPVYGRYAAQHQQ